MPITPLAGHSQLRERLAEAISADRLPRLLLLVGPSGVGKQRLGLWLSQRLVCTSPGDVEPCGSCPSCRQVLDLAYPDVHWFVPVARPKAGEPDKQQEELAEAIGKVMEDRRKKPLWGAPEGLAGHFMATSQLLLKRASLTPRQEEVLRLLAAGRSTDEIAAELHLARETVRNHVRAVLRAVGAHTRLEAVVTAQRLGLLPRRT